MESDQFELSPSTTADLRSEILIRFLLFFPRVPWMNRSISWTLLLRPTVTLMMMVWQPCLGNSPNPGYPHFHTSPHFSVLFLTMLLTESFAFQKSMLFEHGIRRLTFLVAQKVRTTFPRAVARLCFCPAIPVFISVSELLLKWSKQMWTRMNNMQTEILILNQRLKI